MWLYIEEGAASIYPDKWEEFIEPIPKVERGHILSAYHRRCVTNQVLQCIYQCFPQKVNKGGGGPT